MTAASGADRVLVAACENYREDLDQPCTGLARYRWGQIEAPCDTCGGRCGIAVAAWLRVERPASGADRDPLEFCCGNASRCERAGCYAFHQPPASMADVVAAASGADQPTLRNQLREYLPPHQSWCHAEAHGDCCEGDCDCGVEASLDVLVPAVLAYGERAKAEGGAEALEQAARDVDDGEFSSEQSATARRTILARAASLRAASREETGR